MNTIQKDQNTEDSINLLKAQSVAYTKVKKIQLSYELIAVIVALSTPIFYIFLPDYKTIFGYIGSSLSIIALIIDRIQKSKTKTGASIQEMFDRKIFKLSEAEFSGMEKVNSEKILSLAGQYKGDSMENWYSRKITPKTPHNIAVVICQKSNLYWDITLREKYKKILIYISIIYFILFIVTIANSYSKTNDFLFNLFLLLVASSAFIKYSFSTITEKWDMIKEKNNLNIKLDGLINKYNTDGTEPSKEQLSEIQTVIFNTRRKGIKVPDWFYQYHKKQQEKEMDNNAKSLVKKIKKH